MKFLKGKREEKVECFCLCVVGIISCVFGMDMNVVNETVGMISVVSLGLAGVYFAV